MKDHYLVRARDLTIEVPKFLEEVANANVVQGVSLLPGLRDLRCSWTTWREVINIEHVLPSTLRSLELVFRPKVSPTHSRIPIIHAPESLSFEESNGVLPFMSTIFFLPNLSDLTIRNTPEHLDNTVIQPYYQSLFSPTSPVETLSIKFRDNCLLLWPLIGRIPKLASLSVFFDQSPQMGHLIDDTNNNGQELFKSIRSLAIKGDLMEVAKLLGSISSIEIQLAKIEVSQRTFLNPASLCACLHKCQSLTSLKFVKGGSVFVFTMDAIQPLLENCHGIEEFEMHGHGIDMGTMSCLSFPHPGLNSEYSS